MSKIKGQDTKPEEIVRKFLFSKGFRYRKNDKRYPGKPDIILPKYKTVIFVHGCFWHGHKNCKATKLPETNKDFWEKNIKKLKDTGWNVITVWQCEIKNEKVKQKRFDKLIKEIVE
jgi:DNA mismatch endonuclease, patch repair protein